MFPFRIGFVLGCGLRCHVLEKGPPKLTNVRCTETKLWNRCDLVSLGDMKEACGTDLGKGGAGDLQLFTGHCRSISCVSSPP